MRVFVTGIGRVGSVCFRSACEHMTNFTCGHETLCGHLEYPDNHIEINPQLRVVVSHLARKYPEARWVHMIRPPSGNIPSLVLLNHGEVMDCYRRLYFSIMPTHSDNDVAWRYYWTENDLIRVQLDHCVRNDDRMEFHLDSHRNDWRAFWEWVGAEGDFDASLAEWDTPKNTGEQRGEK